MTRFPVDGTGRLSTEREHPTADLVGPAGGDLSGSFPNPTVATVNGQSASRVVTDIGPPSGDTTGAADKAVIDAAITATGGVGVVELQAGTYYYLGQLVLDGYYGLTIRGQVASSTTLIILETAAESISCLSAQPAFEDLMLQCSVGQTHDFILSHATIGGDGAVIARRCQFGQNGVSSRSPNSWISLSRSDGSGARIEDCAFFYGTYGIVNGATGFAINTKVRGCQFNYQTTRGIYSSWSTEAASYVDNTFEPRADARANGIQQASGTSHWATHIENNWFGDVSVAGGIFIQLYEVFGATVINNRMAPVPLGSSTGITVANSSQGVVIMGNRIEACDCGIKSLGAGFNFGITIIGNDLSNCTVGIDTSFIGNGFGVNNSIAGGGDMLTIYDSGSAKPIRVTGGNLNLGIQNLVLSGGVIGADNAGGAGFVLVRPISPSDGTVQLLVDHSGLLRLDGLTLQNNVAGNEATSASAGANGAVPAQVKGYLIAQDHTGTTIKIPYFAA